MLIYLHFLILQRNDFNHEGTKDMKKREAEKEGSP